MNKLYTRNEVIDLIGEGRVMLLSGSEQMLSNLPKGSWIGGTAPYFMDGVGKISDDMIYVDDLTQYAAEVRIEELDEANIHQIALHGFDNGFSVLILPIDAPVYFSFASNSLQYDRIFDNPIVGYVACCRLEDYGRVHPATGVGTTGALSTSKAAVMHVRLPEGYTARAEIMNFDTIDTSTPALKFPKTSFVQSDCLIDGQPGNIAEYLEGVKQRIGRYPQLITSMNGALVNRDTKYVDIDKGEAAFFSPAYEGDEYRIVRPNADYQKAFNDMLAAKQGHIAACFSCTSYFMFGEFEGKHIDINGVYAFGEIAYQLLNKTIVTLEIDRL
ncbi:MAG: hypothetical protein IJU72_00410 [Bacteroidales bacterium]|nr:hypothetical protein [Bacteroidales bacterium]